MALVELDDFRRFIGLSDIRDDDVLQDCLDVAEAAIAADCGRSFAVPGTTTARRFVAPAGPGLDVPDIASLEDLAIATGSGTTFTTPVASTAYHLDPIDTIGPDGGQWPYQRIVRTTGAWPPGPGPTIQITARWGWPATPGPVLYAIKLLAKDLLQAPEYRGGYTAFADLGIARLRENQMVEARIAPYRHHLALGVV